MVNNGITIGLKKQYSIKALKWCESKLGINKRKKKKLKISVRVTFRTPDEKNFYGLYSYMDNRIIVYDLNCISLEDVVSTVIHEYTHYLQSRTKYEMYQKTHFYSTNPLERQAKRNELKYTKVCLKEIRKLLRGQLILQ
jgi:Zn-dependent peptidase ImmA (M78 family)